MIFRSVCRFFIPVFVFVMGGAGMASAQSAPTYAPNAASFGTTDYDPANAGISLPLQGFYYAGDGGGGMLTDYPGGGGICMEAQALVSNTKHLTMVSPFPVGLSPNMGITGHHITSGTTITSYSVAGQQINISNAAGATTPTTEPIFITADSTRPGATFLDSGGNCFIRMNPTYSQKEWGAYSDGATDDTPALQNWLDANQPHIAVPGNSMISNTLYCGTDSSGNILTDGTIIQGSPATSSGADGQPTFLVTANDKVSLMNTWGGGPAMFVMNQPNKVTAAVFAVDASSAGNAVAVTEF